MKLGLRVLQPLLERPVLRLDLRGGAKQAVDDRPQGCRVGLAGEAPVEAVEILGIPVSGAPRSADGREDVADVSFDLSADRFHVLAEAKRRDVFFVYLLDLIGRQRVVALERLVEGLIESGNEAACVSVP